MKERTHINLVGSGAAVKASKPKRRKIAKAKSRGKAGASYKKSRGIARTTK